MISNSKDLVLYLGNFGDRRKLNGSQVKKTNSIYNYLITNGLKVSKVNSEKLKTIYFPVYIIYLIIKLITVEKIIVSLNKNGLKIGNYFLLNLINKFNKKVFFVTIGGWMPEFLETNKKALEYFYSYNRIYVQSNKIKSKLEKLGLNNVINMHNFCEYRIEELENRKKNILLENYKEKDKIRLIFFSFIRKEKGLDLIVNAIEKANEKLNKNIFSLDIVGPIDKSYQLKFNRIIKEHNFCKYKGVINNQHEIYEFLSNYDFLVFPTYYEGEGFPTVIVESFVSGLPVLASDWKYNSEIIKEKQNGLLFESKNINELVNKLEWLFNNKKNIQQMKLNCLQEARKYHPDKIIGMILDDIKNL